MIAWRTFSVEDLGTRSTAALFMVLEYAWNGVALARDAEPVLVRQALPGNPTDRQACYVEAAVNGLLGASLYLPNGNPWPGPKFDYKMAWFERLLLHSKALWETGHPVALMGDFNVVPTDADIYSPTTWLDNALLQPEPRNSTGLAADGH